MIENASIAQYISCSRGNGPGKRAVIWVQGCSRRCMNCSNPNFQPFKPCNITTEIISEKIIYDFHKYSLRGVTFSGGEPLHYLHEKTVCEIIDNVRSHVDIDIMAFSGYTVVPLWAQNYFDMIITGPYLEKLSIDTGIIASKNQHIIRFSDKFNDICDYRLKYDKRIIEVFRNNDEVIITGLIGKNNGKKVP